MLTKAMGMLKKGQEIAQPGSHPAPFVGPEPRVFCAGSFICWAIEPYEQ